ncbi:hypothetical protein HDU78_003436 [Chytriomyces hyalinus]|nr:hypothetical protein HDU78_003436 [Chytriomyces hyalinus]
MHPSDLRNESQATSTTTAGTLAQQHNSYASREQVLSYHSNYDEGEIEEDGMESDAESDLFEVFDVVDSVVPRTDNPSTPTVTFRVLVIGILGCIINTAINTIFSFRTNSFSVSPSISVVLAYPVGLLMARTLPIKVFTLPRLPFSTALYAPTFTLNPGPFNYKEHILILVFCSATTQVYASVNIIVQRFYLKMPMSPAWCFIFILVNNVYGYGFAGMFRKFLVRPSAMLWPQILTHIALVRTLHNSHDDQLKQEQETHEMEFTATRAFSTSTDKSLLDEPGTLETQTPPRRSPWSRVKVFIVCAGIMFVWQFVPSYIAPFFGAVSVLCLALPTTDAFSKFRLFGSAQQGVGLLSFTFDWSMMGSPIAIPLWALVNDTIGCWLLYWLVIPLLWQFDFFGADSKLGTSPAMGPNGTGQFTLGYALNTQVLFSRNLEPVSVFKLLETSTQTTLNETYYNSVKPLFITTDLAMTYGSKFMSITAAIMHVVLWYGRDIYNRAKTATRDLDADDVHAQMIDVYPEVPDAWYVSILVINTVLALAMCEWGGFDLPWWMVILSMVMAVALLLPSGMIFAISGIPISANVLFELVAGYMLPGKMISTMTFKTLTYVSVNQGLGLTQDLKLGHYCKIPPRDMFLVQLLSSVISSIVAFVTCFGVFDAVGDKIQAGLDGWTATFFQNFMTSGLIWGAIGPARFFGPSSPYESLLYCFLIGAVLPILPWFFHRQGWGRWWPLINIPLLVTLPEKIGSVRSDMISPVLVGFLVNYLIKRWNHSWWSRNAYVLSSAFDTGAAFSLLIIFFALRMQGGPMGVLMPFYALNRLDPELCSPWWFVTCTEHMVQAGAAYDPSEDIAVCQTFGMEAMMMMGPPPS